MQQQYKKRRKRETTSDSTTPASTQQTAWQGGYENIDTQDQSPDLPVEVWDVINSKLPLSAKMQFAQVSRGAYALGYVSNNRNALYNNFYKKPFHNSLIRAGREQVQAFGLHVIRGEKKEAEKMILADPSLLLATIRVKDYSGRTIEGTALGMALGAEDVSYDGSKCDIAVVQPPEDLKNLTLEYIKNLNIIKKAGYVRCADKLFYRDKLNDGGIEIKLDQTALKQFDAELKPQPKARTLSKEEVKQITSLTGHDHCVIKTGKHFSIQLLVKAFELYDKKYDDFGGFDSRKNNLFWQKVIGTIQRYLPACWAQAVCQGVYYIIEDSEKLRRCLKFRFNNDVVFFPLDSDPDFQLGDKYAGGALFGAALGRSSSPGFDGTRALQNYVRQKTATLRGFTTQRPDNHNYPKSRCAVM
ncbi:TPA: hypothetical protein JA361_10350 [Legionella pneumophila]|nr:hypothetical protein [Legionella pneumophila]HAT8181498.1 hypothetical protein [Legionella pneumophila]